MNHPERSSRDVATLQQENRRLQAAIRQFETKRDLATRARWRQRLIVGVGISMLAHLCLMLYLASNYRPGHVGIAPPLVSYEFAIVSEEELTAFESTELDDLLPDVVGELDDLSDADSSLDLDPQIPAAELEVTSAGALPTLVGSGDAAGGAQSLSGGAVSTSFFGVSSRGMRFAFIVDRSGSMGRFGKMPIAVQELARSIGSLPDYASFHVLLFSGNVTEPPMQRGWMRAKKATVNRFVRWLNRVEPNGGTEPRAAFEHVFALDVRPDVIFFLTDGIIPADIADVAAHLNRGGERVIINTIAFGNAGSQDQLKRIARASGGTYRYVPSEER